MPTSIAAAILEATQVLRKASLAEPRREAGSLLARVLTRDQAFLITHAEDLIEANDLDNFREYVKRRSLGEPLQYITGRQEFFGLEFEVSPAVLIPRPETELLVEAAIELASDLATPFICDVGTGSGCIVIALLHELTNARAIAVDISDSALSLAARNAARLGVDERVTFAISDCLDMLDKTEYCFDLIVSNPPYIPANEIAGLQREVRDHEPHVALTPGNEGLSIIQRLLAESPNFLIGGGHLVMEIGFSQCGAVEGLIDNETWKLISIRKDLQGIPRTVTLQKRD